MGPNLIKMVYKNYRKLLFTPFDQKILVDMKMSKIKMGSKLRLYVRTTMIFWTPSMYILYGYYVLCTVYGAVKKA